MYIEKFVGPVVPADGEETTEPANVSAEGGEATLSPLEVRGISGAAVFLHCVGAEGGGIPQNTHTHHHTTTIDNVKFNNQTHQH